MREFDFERAVSVEDALRRHADDAAAAWLAGGLSLVPEMKWHRREPARVIDISRLDALRGIALDGATLAIGAGETHARIAASDVVREAVPALAELADGIGHPSVRHLGTLGGTLAMADPVSDWPAAVLALGATIETNARAIAADDFFVGGFATALTAGELILRVRFPVATAAAYRKFPNPASRYAMAGAFVARVHDEVRVAVSGAGPTVHRSDRLERALSERFEPPAAASVELDPADYVDDLHGDAAYRAQLVRTMAARAVARILCDGVV